MNPEVKKIFVLFNELIQNQSDNILLPLCLKLPNSNSRVFLRNKLTNRRPSKYQYILTFEDLLKLKETDIVDSCDKVIVLIIPGAPDLRFILIRQCFLVFGLTKSLPMLCRFSKIT